MPYLLSTQLASYTQFLQLDRAMADRQDEGLQAAFTSIFPIVSHNQMARLEFVNYALGNPAFDVTPAELVSALITEKGVVHHPDEAKLKKLFQS